MRCPSLPVKSNWTRSSVPESCEFCHLAHVDYWCSNEELVEIAHNEYRPNAGGYITLQRGALPDLAFAAFRLMGARQRETFLARVADHEE